MTVIAQGYGNPFTIEHRRNCEHRVSYHPRDIRDSIYDWLGDQIRSCVFAPSDDLMETLGFEAGDADSAEVFNISEDHEGLEERVVGWTFILRYVPDEPDYEEGGWF